MEQVPAQPAGLAVELDAVVRVAPRPASAAPVEQAELRIRIPGAVADPAPEIRTRRGSRQPGGRETRLAQAPDLRLQLGGDALVGVDAEHPVVEGGADRKFFLRDVPGPVSLDHACAPGGGDLARGVARMRIHHHDLVAERERGQAIPDAIRLVLRDHAGGEAGGPASWTRFPERAWC
jgi:hypothetical protein